MYTLRNPRSSKCSRSFGLSIALLNMEGRGLLRMLSPGGRSSKLRQWGMKAGRWTIEEGHGVSYTAHWAGKQAPEPSSALHMATLLEGRLPNAVCFTKRPDLLKLTSPFSFCNWNPDSVDDRGGIGTALAPSRPMQLHFLPSTPTDPLWWLEAVTIC